MKAITTTGFGAPNVLELSEVKQPEPGPGQVLIAVEATSVNRPDIIQREGRYPPPPGDSDILGLEAAGRIAALGANVRLWQVGDAVTALLGGGGYAEFAVADAGHLMQIPDWMSFAHAACIPEAYITAYQNLFLNARLEDGEAVLLHGGGGGVNTAAIQICRALTPNCRVIVTASTEKCVRVAELGADHVIDYTHEDFTDRVLEITDQQGANVILDHIGGAYFEKNCAALAIGGRLSIIATLGGREARINLARMMVNRQSIIGSVLRPRSIAEKAAIIKQFAHNVMPHFSEHGMLPVIERTYPLRNAAEAHALMESRQHFGKIVLRVGEER